MVLQGFNAFERSTTEIVEFCERIEFTERLHNDAKGKSSRTDSKSSFTHGKGQGKSSDGANKNNKRNGRGYCPLHDTTSHDISECKVILNQAKKMRDSWQSRSSDERRSFKKKDKEVNAVMKEFAAALKDGRITRKKRKAPNGKTYDVYNVQEDFSQLTMSTNSDSDASSVTSDNSWRLGESLYAFESDSSLESLDDNLTEQLYSLGQRYDRTKPKRTQTPLTRPITFGQINVRLGKPKYKSVKILCDSGATATIVKHGFVKNLRLKRQDATTWKTPAGNFQTKSKCEIDFKMPEFHQHRNIKWKAYVTTQPMLYDIILGQDLMQELGLIIDYKTNTLKWDDATIAMKPVDAQPAELFEIPEGKALKEASNRLEDILAAKYAPANLEEVVETCKHLDSTEKLELYQLLTEFEDYPNVCKFPPLPLGLLEHI